MEADSASKHVGKLVEKPGALVLRRHAELWNERAFARRPGKGAIDSVMWMLQIAEKHPEGEIVGRDAKSAFNTVQRGPVRRVLH